MSDQPVEHWISHLVECVRAACVLEATARKPGNVHPEASFADLTYDHFRQTASLLGPVIAHAQQAGVGRTVLSSIEATQTVSPTNANLGIVLLLAPLAAVPQDRTLAAGIGAVLNRLTIDDARLVYEAIRLARPGGLGRVSEADVTGAPAITLREAMVLAADRDRIALQYAGGFADVLEFGARYLTQESDFASHWERAVIGLHLELLARFPDSLIARKCGAAVAAEASQRARAVLSSGWPERHDSAESLKELDRWLRADGNRRNPGTTADLVAASLFAAFREKSLAAPEWVKTRVSS